MQPSLDLTEPAQLHTFDEPVVRLRRLHNPPLRSLPYDMEPGYYASGGIWLYGNARLFQGRLGCVKRGWGPNLHDRSTLADIEAEAERLVLDGTVLVCGIHNEAHRRAAVVPLRWGAPRIVVVSGGFYHHLGPNLSEEPFRVARLWRYEWDPKTDLAVSRRAPEKLPTYAHHNPTVDRMIDHLASGTWPGLRADGDPLLNLLAAPA